MTLTPSILRLIAEIDEFKGYWRGLSGLSIETLTTLRRFATIESIGSSTRIEGAKLSDLEIETLLRGLDVKSFRNRDEEEVAGYAVAMKLISESHSDIPLTENNVMYLHKLLLQHSSKDQWHLGSYKHHANHVAAFDETGVEIGIVFETTTPLETPHQTRALIEQIASRFASMEEHPLLIVADFVVHFLAIHPFQDGNGRLSRILTNLLLLRSGYDFIQYASLEQQIELHKQDYYLALRKTQTKFDDPAWNEFFLLSLKRQKDHLSTRLDQQRQTQVMSLPESIRQLVKERGRASITDITDQLQANRNTVKSHLKSMVKNGLLQQHGKGRGVYYTLF